MQYRKEVERKWSGRRKTANSEKGRNKTEKK